MAKFLTGVDLNAELGNLFEGANEQLILISPYIKLHVHYESILKSKKNNPKLKIILVFGKNETDISKSMGSEVLNFFKDFPNIQIRHEKRLHAKYYASENFSILTSMNLYDYSQDHNIEAAVKMKGTPLTNWATTVFWEEESLDTQMSKAFQRVIEQSELIYHKIPQYDKGVLNSNINKKYLNSKVEVDRLSEFFTDKSTNESKSSKGISKNINIEEQHKDFNGKFLSTSALAKELGISNKDLNNKIEKLKWIENKNDEWVLTGLGESKGAQLKKGQYGEYIAYPETVIAQLTRN